jgi:hypothetical protein
MTDPVKYISIKEFREKGYLQELNRRFLHPLGLALAIDVKDDGEEVLKGVWDYREDPEGIYYDLENSDEERKNRFYQKASYVEKELQKRKEKRKNKLGFEIEPIVQLIEIPPQS